MKVTLMLADYAQAVDGKLNIIGGGWSVITPGAPFGIACKIEVPWNRATEEHSFRLELLDIDGHPVCVEHPEAEEPTPIMLDGTFSTGIPAGIKAGTPLDAVFAVPFVIVPLDAGKRYEWRLSIDGQTEDDWYVAFKTRPESPAALAA
jgi:hypothetical protein